MFNLKGDFKMHLLIPLGHLFEIRLRNEQLTVYLSKLSLEKEQTAQEKNAVAAEVKKLQEQQEDSKKKEENTKQLVENLEEANSQLRNELESLKEKMAKTGEEVRSTLDEREENMNNLKKQVENKTKCIEELQQENKVLPKKLTAESKKSNTYEGKVNKLQIEMEKMNKQHKEAADIYQKDIETRKGNENKLREENEYDKMVEEKDAELKVYKMKQQKQFSSARALENELSSLKSELASIREQLKAEIEEKTYAIKTPPMDKMHSGRSTNLPSEQSSRKKQKVLVQLDTQSDSSEHTDLLSIVLEEEMFKNLYKDFPQASRLHSPAPKKLHPV
ncbi:synaptonemal complex protein 1-like isoform X2 [Molothrus ater]|uniref:synaptonemal complex protein 1-like isoform X2 n=1 Tax=Molothrus ater TaxID=84834 RepID=UPI0023E8BF10|nr:synaptonemal complex protein 1-like isoform X2 [Molothrus ater]